MLLICVHVTSNGMRNKPLKNTRHTSQKPNFRETSFAENEWRACVRARARKKPMRRILFLFCVSSAFGVGVEQWIVFVLVHRVEHLCVSIIIYTERFMSNRSPSVPFGVPSIINEILVFAVAFLLATANDKLYDLFGCQRPYSLSTLQEMLMDSTQQLIRHTHTQSI